MKKRPFTKAQWKQINHRRCQLIDKKYDNGLTTQEAKELEALQKKAKQYLEFFEGPSVDMILQQVRKLKQDAHSAPASLIRRKRLANPHRNCILALLDKEVSRGLTEREKADLARLQKEGMSWTMLEVGRHPPTAGEVTQMDKKAKEFTRTLLGRK